MKDWTFKLRIFCNTQIEILKWDSTKGLRELDRFWDGYWRAMEIVIGRINEIMGDNED